MNMRGKLKKINLHVVKIRLLAILTAMLIIALPGNLSLASETVEPLGKIYSPFTLGLGFGMTSNSSPEFHYGIDLVAEAGTPFKSPVSGIVTFSGFTPGGGNCLTIQTEGGYLITISWLKGLMFKKGDSIKRGDIVGYVEGANDPSLNEPHIHLSIRNAERKYLNPLEFLVLECSLDSRCSNQELNEKRSDSFVENSLPQADLERRVSEFNSVENSLQGDIIPGRTSNFINVPSSQFTKVTNFDENLADYVEPQQDEIKARLQHSQPNTDERFDYILSKPCFAGIEAIKSCKANGISTHKLPDRIVNNGADKKVFDSVLALNKKNTNLFEDKLASSFSERNFTYDALLTHLLKTEQNPYPGRNQENSMVTLKNAFAMMIPEMSYFSGYFTRLNIFILSVILLSTLKTAIIRFRSLLPA